MTTPASTRTDTRPAYVTTTIVCEPDQITATAGHGIAVVNIGSVSIVGVSNRNRVQECAELARIGERIAVEARRAAHRYRTERRTAEFAAAVAA